MSSRLALAAGSGPGDPVGKMILRIGKVSLLDPQSEVSIDRIAIPFVHPSTVSRASFKETRIVELIEATTALVSRISPYEGEPNGSGNVA